MLIAANMYGRELTTLLPSKEDSAFIEYMLKLCIEALEYRKCWNYVPLGYDEWGGNQFGNQCGPINKQTVYITAIQIILYNWT